MVHNLGDHNFGNVDDGVSLDGVDESLAYLDGSAGQHGNQASSCSYPSRIS